jgi:sterol desaturase/sphingolipid hydroxylase (fatty acid hydroxylase superfamily)
MNYGGILIIYDRLFGTFTEAPRDEPLRYGVIGGEPTYNPVRIAFAGWRRLFRDAARAPSLTARLKVLFGPPS